MGITWMCEILVATIFVILMIVPAVAVLITVEITTRKRIQRRNRISVSQPYNPYALADL